MDTIRLARRDFVRYEVTFITEPGKHFSITIQSGVVMQGLLVVDCDYAADEVVIYNVQCIRHIKSFRGQFK